jgi:hypothetical protein
MSRIFRIFVLVPRLDGEAFLGVTPGYQASMLPVSFYHICLLDGGLCIVCHLYIANE